MDQKVGFSWDKVRSAHLTACPAYKFDSTKKFDCRQCSYKNFGQKHWAVAFISLAADFKDKFLLGARSAERYIISSVHSSVIAAYVDKFCSLAFDLGNFCLSGCG